MGKGERSDGSMGALVHHALLLPVYAVTCVFALVFVPHRVGLLLSSALEVAGGSRSARHAPLAAGATACVLALAMVAACGIGCAAAAALPIHDGARTLAIGAVALCAPALLGAVVAPFVLAPLALLDGEEGVVASLVRSFELAARRGAARTVRDGASLGAGIGLVSLLVMAAAESGPPVAWTILVLAAALVIGAPLAAVAVARAYVDARGRPAFGSAASVGVSRSLRTVALLIAPAMVALAVALLAALVRPAPMAPLDAPLPGWRGALPRAREHDQTTAIPGAHGVLVRARARGVSVEAADGGGAGEISLPRSAETPDTMALAVHRDGDRWAVVRDGEHVTYVDDQGVRLDDGLGARLAARVDGQVMALLLCALGLGVWWQRRMRGAMAEAAALDAPEARHPSTKGGDDLPPTRFVRIPGRVRLDEGTVVIAHGGTAHVEGAGRFVSSDGETVMALPAEFPLVVPHDAGAIADGSEVTLLARGDALARLGLREGSAPWPAGARLLAVDRDDAAEALLSRAARASSLVALAIAVALAWAALAIVARL